VNTRVPVYQSGTGRLCKVSLGNIREIERSAILSRAAYRWAIEQFGFWDGMVRKFRNKAHMSFGDALKSSYWSWFLRGAKIDDNMGTCEAHFVKANNDKMSTGLCDGRVATSSFLSCLRIAARSRQCLSVIYLYCRRCSDERIRLKD